MLGIKTPIFEIGEKLLPFLASNIPKLIEKDIIVVTSKIIALAEKRVATHNDKERFIQKCSLKTIQTPWAYLTLTTDGWGINAGIDESNAQNGVVLMPINPFATAEKIRAALMKKYKLKKLGILITDTRSIPLRAGTVGRTVGIAGFFPFKSYIGKDDLFGRKSRVTVSNQADALAASAVCVMGEGNEQIPLVLIRNAPVTFTSKTLSSTHQKLSLTPQADIFKYVFKSENL